MSRRRGALALTIALLAGAVGAVRGVARRRVRHLPFCPLFADGRVGADWARRNGFEGDRVPGEIEDFSVYDRDPRRGRDGFDAGAIHPEVRRFYERTTDYDLVYETTWHRGFRIGARIASIATGWLEQLNLPGRSDAGSRRLESRIARVPASADPREGTRVWTRTDPATGEAVFVAIYATCERDGVTYANVAVPLPRSNLSTVLRPERLGPARESDGTGAGVRFTTRGADAGGLYLVTPFGAVGLPMEQEFRVRPAEGEARVEAPDGPVESADSTSLVATHEMWLCGRQFLTISYGIERETGR